MFSKNPIVLCLVSALALFEQSNAVANEVNVNKPMEEQLQQKTLQKQTAQEETVQPEASSLKAVKQLKETENKLSGEVKSRELVDSIVKDSQVKNGKAPDKKTQDKLIKKLNQFNFFTANFSQVVQDVDGNLLQSGSGSLSIIKPNMVNWNTQQPEESLIVADGETLWFFDPFIEQASAYSLQNAIANTPILLLTSDAQELWQHYRVSEINHNTFVIHSNDESAQVKSLELRFNSEKLSALIILDATGQVSTITLKNIDYKNEPDLALFKFVLPKGIHLDDQR